MKFARWVFLLAEVSGMLLIVPPHFLERQTSEDYPPTTGYSGLNSTTGHEAEFVCYDPAVG